MEYSAEDSSEILVLELYGYPTLCSESASGLQSPVRCETPEGRRFFLCPVQIAPTLWKLNNGFPMYFPQKMGMGYLVVLFFLAVRGTKWETEKTLYT